jgi:hypothetical protein
LINATGILGNVYMPFKKGRPASTFEGKATDKDSDQ